ncbi:hypothetical protein [Thalassospira lohafexi]|uniref:Phasin domain-containing protein n=1 Tax=Thalassospira lohafexi TaxID=744227 RepID=A0A2N3L251_9PROT|nr:hypothetical protein [Thalassospira lohafexi]PKR56894.1 hypothetical protein COO92_18070 [Thalassospira lohafexi]
MADDDTPPKPANTEPKGADDPTTPDAADNADAKDTKDASGGSTGAPDAPKASGGDGSDKDTPPSDSPPAAPSTPPLSTALNPQIVQAVGTTNHAVLNGAIPGANGVAYQKVAQAAAYAVQDSTDYMRNIMSMASATTGVAMQKMLAENTPDPYSKIIEAATKAVADAQKTFSSVGEAASGVVKDFDSMA